MGRARAARRPERVDLRADERLAGAESGRRSALPERDRRADDGAAQAADVPRADRARRGRAARDGARRLAAGLRRLARHADDGGAGALLLPAEPALLRGAEPHDGAGVPAVVADEDAVHRLLLRQLPRRRPQAQPVALHADALGRRRLGAVYAAAPASGSPAESMRAAGSGLLSRIPPSHPTPPSSRSLALEQTRARRRRRSCSGSPRCCCRACSLASPTSTSRSASSAPPSRSGCAMCSSASSAYHRARRCCSRRRPRRRSRRTASSSASTRSSGRSSRSRPSAGCSWPPSSRCARPPSPALSARTPLRTRPVSFTGPPRGPLAWRRWPLVVEPTRRSTAPDAAPPPLLHAARAVRRQHSQDLRHRHLDPDHVPALAGGRHRALRPGHGARRRLAAHVQ